MPSFRPAVPLVLLLAGAAGAQEPPGRVVLPGETRQYLSRLKLAHALAVQKKWAEAVDEYQRLLNDAGDALVPAEAAREELHAAPRSVQLRRLCHLGLAALPPPGLAVYRRRVDLQARRWLQQGLAGRDPNVLRRIVDEAFCSRAGDQALDALGDLAFERAHFAQAGRWWRLLAVPASEARTAKEPPAGTLHFPDPQVDVARVRAKQILALVFADDLAAAAVELTAFRKLDPKAAGHLAGRDGNYAAILQEWLDRPPGFPERKAWPTFGGSPARGRDLPAAPPRRLWADGPTWRVRLDNPARPVPSEEEKPTVSAALARRLAFHPVIVEDRVLLADARQVLAFDLWSGRPLFRYDLAQDGGRQDVPEAKLPADPDVRYILTVADGRVYARLGAAAAPKGDSCLVCLDLTADGKARRRQRWLVRAPAKAGAAVFFEGAPVVRAGRVYVAVSRPAGGRTRTAIACYDADGGAFRGEQEVCDVPGSSGRRHLLTLAGDLVVYGSDAGAVVALDAETGKLAWGVRYPSRGPTLADGDPSPRDLAPPVYADGRLFVAPADADRLFCLDPYSGRMLWERDGIEVVHLLGCSHGRLFFTTPRGIRAVGARIGSDAGGWLQPAEGRLPGFGRGLLAGGLVFWPVQDAKLPLRVLNVENGTQWKGEAYFEPTQLRRIWPGNMAYGQGCLVVAGVDELVGYVPPEKFLEQRRKDAARPGAGAKALYRLALAEAGAGLYEKAWEHFIRLEHEVAIKARKRRSWSIRDVRRERLDMLLDLARKADGVSAPDKLRNLALLLLGKEATPETLYVDMLPAATRLAGLWERAGQPRKAVAVWQDILRDGRRSIGPRAASEIQKLIDKHGRAVYQDVETEAARFASSLKDTDPFADFSRLLWRYPNAEVVRTRLRKLVQTPADPGSAPAAAQACRLYLHLGQGRDNGPALLGLAQAYEAERCWDAARVVWQLLAEHRGEEWTATEPKILLRDLAAKRLQRPEYRALASPNRDSARPALTLPLARAWETPSSRPLPTTRNALTPRKAQVFLSRDAYNVFCHDAATGALCWTCRAPIRPSWFGCHADTVLGVDELGVQCVRLADGQRAWFRYADDHPLSGPRLTNSRLFFLEAGRRLVALDLDSGFPAWTCWAPSARLLPRDGGRFQPHYYAGERWVILQTTGGKRLVFDSRTGHKVHEAGAATRAWPQPPVPITPDRFAIVDSGRRVLLLDAATGKEVWTWKPRLPTTLSGEPPRLFGGRDALLILVPRNIGYDLERLDPMTGTHLWPEAFRLLDRPVDAGAVAIDRKAVYLATGNALLARSLADGKLLWMCKLEESAPRWRVQRAANCLVVWPQERDWLRWSWLPAGEFAVAAPLRARLGQPFPVLLYRPEDGKLLQRLSFETTMPEGTVQLFQGRLVVGVPGKAWGLQGPAAE